MTEKKGWKEIPLGGMICEAGSSSKFKTGDWKSFRPIWNKEKCTQCMMCVVYCPEDCIPRKDDKRLETDLSVCKGCGICKEICPVKCIEMKEEGASDE
ncbi:4Fe-4S binding protein [Candidatus Woesearchaeota archaeon]|nr:4Fe-4S binding protein [Candidatus Woesearchaeota archaeon]